MSLVQFDEIYEICCEFVAMDEVGKALRVNTERLELADGYVQHQVANRWWDNAVRELEKDHEKEILLV